MGFGTDPKEGGMNDFLTHSSQQYSYMMMTMIDEARRSNDDADE